MSETAQSSGGPTAGKPLVVRVLGAALLCAYPLLTHHAAVHSLPGLAFAALACLVVFVLLNLLRTPLKWLLVAVPPAAAYLAPTHWNWLLFLPPAAINLSLAWLFGRTLTPDAKPMISRFAELDQGMLTPELTAYTWGLTAIWTGFFVTMSFVSIGLAASGWLYAWSLFTNVINYALAVGLLAGDYGYRLARFRNYRFASPLAIMRRVRESGALRR